MSKNSENNQLLKILGVGFGIAATIGGTVGSGILRKPGPIAEALGNPTLILGLWLLVGLYAYLGVLCVIELALSMPQAGAWYVYGRRAFGDYFGFLTGITSWFGTVSAVGFGAYTLAEYISRLTGWGDYNQLMAVGLIALFTLIHWIGTNLGGKAQQVLTYTNAFFLILFVLLCFTIGHKVDPTLMADSAQKTVKAGFFLGIITALQSIFYAYDGWHTATYFTEENSDPAKNMPKAMISGVLGIILIYFLVNAAILYVLPMDQLQKSELAAADAMGVLFGERANKIVTLFLLISILGVTNSQVMFAPRVIFSMGRDGLFTKLATRVNAAGSPYIALFLTSLLSILLIMSGKETCGMLSDIATFFFVMSYAAGFVSLIKLRKTEPNLPRPFKAPFFPYLPIFLTIASVAFLIGAVYADSKSSMYGLGFLVLSYPLYLLVKKWNQ
jgi:basic amino acid/polyamine antiporter, APA family